jgi:hypothetical protein
MRIKAAGTTLTVAELREALADIPDSAEVLFEDYGSTVCVETGPFSVMFEAVETMIDRDEQAWDHAEFVGQVADGTIKTLGAIRKRAKELNY